MIKINITGIIINRVNKNVIVKLSRMIKNKNNEKNITIREHIKNNGSILIENISLILILLSFKYGMRIIRLEIIVANPIPKTEPVLPNNFDNGHVKASIEKRNEILEMTFHFKNPVPRFILKGITELKEIILDKDNMSINNEKMGLIS